MVAWGKARSATRLGSMFLPVVSFPLGRGLRGRVLANLLSPLPSLSQREREKPLSRILSLADAYVIILAVRRGRIIGSAAVLKTAARKGLQVRVLSPPPLFPARYSLSYTLNSSSSLG